MNVLSEPEVTEHEIKNLARNLKLLLNEYNISEGTVAQALNIPVITIRRIVSGETADPRISTLKQIADYFNVNVDSLIKNNAEKSIALMNKNTPTFIPVLNWELISRIQSINELDLKNWKEWHPIAAIEKYTFSQNVFALESRPSMQPRYPIGTLFIIEPHENPTDGDIVLIKIKEDSDISLRELVIDPPLWRLQPIVNGSEAISFDKNKYIIIGVVVLTMLYTKKKLR